MESAKIIRGKFCITCICAVLARNASNTVIIIIIIIVTTTTTIIIIIISQTIITV